MTLTIGSDRVTGEGLSHLARLQQLRILNLECPGLGDDHLGELAHCEALTSLSLRGDFGDAAWDVLGRMTHLTSLGLDSPRLTCAGVEPLSRFKELHTLTLRGFGPAATDEALDVISRLPQLKTLIIQRGEAVTNEGLAHLSASANLEMFTLYQARQITDEGLAPLAKLSHLKHLQLQDAAKISEAALTHFRGARQLQSLHLGGSRVPPEAIKSLLEELRKLP